MNWIQLVHEWEDAWIDRLTGGYIDKSIHGRCLIWSGRRQVGGIRKFKLNGKRNKKGKR